MSTFYANFPNYVFNNNLLTDLSVRIKIRDSWLNDETLYYRYIYKDSDKPEHIALKYYGDETLHWILLLTNGIFDTNYDFPMSIEVFNKYISDKYKDNNGVKTIRILENGSGYVDGEYSNIPLSILNPTELTKIGTGAKVDVRVVGGEISNIEVRFCGTGYDANTLFYISTEDLQATNSATFSILNFMEGFEYALITPDPVYRYQKQVKISKALEVPQFYNYVIDENSYYNLYDDYPSETKEVVIDEEVVSYEVSRRTPEVTIYDKEFEINESKRVIRILKKDYIVLARTEILNLLGS